VSDYTVGEFNGKGSFGMVYEGTHLSSGKKVAHSSMVSIKYV